ncbi:MAG: penicillin acylase family protein, partial [Bacteroidales bacterium]
GFIASANNLPFPTKIPIAFEYTGYNRMQRMNEIASHSDSISIEMLTQLQTDVLSYESLEIKELIIKKTGKDTRTYEKVNQEYWKAFSGWDGNYYADARGPVAFETLMYFFASSIIGEYYPQEYMKDFFMTDDRWKVLLPELIRNETPEKIKERMILAMKNGEKYFDKYENWGGMHRLVFGSTLARVPLIGNKYKLADLGMHGSSGTLYKTAHSFTPEKHTISYGSNSRHISNMADIDENYFVLLGGQDDWIKSPHNYDQLELWQKRE